MKGWTSNIHGLEWLRRVFEPATRDKAKGQPRLLLCDGHDSHISGNFIAHCMEHNIVLIVLPPHTTHLTQPLDVAVFGPLSTAHGQAVDRLSRTGLARLTKAEWVDIYIKARQKAIVKKNIKAAWKGAGLIPLNRFKVLNHLADGKTTTPKPPTKRFRPTTLITSSPPNGAEFFEKNRLLRTKLSRRQPLDTPSRKHVVELTTTAERLAAQVSILRTETAAQSAVLGARRKRNSGKRAVLKGKFIVRAEEILKGVQAAERQTAQKKRKRLSISSDEDVGKISNGSESTEGSGDEEGEVEDTIVCQFR
jgi:hypothetical protein